MAVSAGWPRAPCAPPGPSRGQDRGEQRSWGAAVLGLGGCCAWDPIAEDGAEVVPPGVWGAAWPPAPALLRIQMSHLAQALPGGPGQAGSSVGAAPLQPPHCRLRGSRVCSLRVWGTERCCLHLRVHTSQWSGEATLYLWSSPPTGSSQHSIFPILIFSKPQAGQFPQASWRPSGPPSW